MLRFFAATLALALLSASAHAASGPLVTGKCWCAIGWGMFQADCGSSKVTCTKPMCAAACQARLQRKAHAAPPTDVSAARRRHADRPADGYAPPRQREWSPPPPPSHQFKAMWSRAAQYDRDGRILRVAQDAPRTRYAPRGRVSRTAYVRHRPEAIVRQALASVAAVARITQAVVGTIAGGAAGALKGASLASVDARLVDIMQNAVRILPAGFSVIVTSGYRRHDGPHDGHAIDLRIVDGAGRPLPNRGADTSGLYERLARAGYGYVLARYPELRGRFGWGGSFETRAGSGVADIMHYDLMGDRGNHFRPRLAALGPLTLADQVTGRGAAGASSARRSVRVRHGRGRRA